MAGGGFSWDFKSSAETDASASQYTGDKTVVFNAPENKTSLYTLGAFIVAAVLVFARKGKK